MQQRIFTLGMFELARALNASVVVFRKAPFISKRGTLALVLTTICLAPTTSAAYSVLAHEALIDGAWDSHITPLLRRRFPHASREDLEAARAFAYGGSAVQDLGYYPFGNHFVSDLLHYVRTGDFVETLLADARNLNEYAFGLGSLPTMPPTTPGIRRRSIAPCRFSFLACGRNTAI